MDGSGPASIPENIPREISGLDPASWLVLWGIRYWACCYRSNRSSWPMLNDLFERNHIASATFSLNGLMRISALTTRRSLDIRCPACSGISGVEHHALIAGRGLAAGEEDVLALEQLL